MADKQSDQSVQISVRLPAQLKQRLEAAARARRSSFSAEVTRALAEQYSRLGTDQMQLAQLNARTAVLEAQLAFLEDRVLELSEAVPLALLESMQCGIRQRRAAKTEAEEEAGRRREQHRETVNAADPASKRRASPFDGLVNPTAEEVEQLAAQLEVPERRRLNLLLYLDTRPRGTKSTLAATLGWKRARVSHVLAPPYSGAYRPISDDTARRIEAALQLKAGELDKLELNRHQVQWHRTLLKFDAALEHIRNTLLVN